MNQTTRGPSKPPKTDSSENTSSVAQDNLSHTLTRSHLTDQLLVPIPPASYRSPPGFQSASTSSLPSSHRSAPSQERTTTAGWRQGSQKRNTKSRMSTQQFRFSAKSTRPARNPGRSWGKTWLCIRTVLLRPYPRHAHWKSTARRETQERCERFPSFPWASTRDSDANFRICWSRMGCEQRLYNLSSKRPTISKCHLLIPWGSRSRRLYTRAANTRLLAIRT